MLLPLPLLLLLMELKVGMVRGEWVWHLSVLLDVGVVEQHVDIATGGGISLGIHLLVRVLTSLVHPSLMSCCCMCLCSGEGGAALPLGPQHWVPMMKMMMMISKAPDRGRMLLRRGRVRGLLVVGGVRSPLLLLLLLQVQVLLSRQCCRGPRKGVLPGGLSLPVREPVPVTPLDVKCGRELWWRWDC